MEHRDTPNLSKPIKTERMRCFDKNDAKRNTYLNDDGYKKAEETDNI